MKKKIAFIGKSCPKRIKPKKVKLTKNFEKMSKHFRKHHSEDLKKRKVTRLGSCDNKHFIYDSPEDKWQGDDIIVPGALYYMDGEGCSAGFSTDENFGCVHHEET